MKSYKSITDNEAQRIMCETYPQATCPLMDSRDIPNNWLKMHGYAMHRGGKKDETRHWRLKVRRLM